MKLLHTMIRVGNLEKSINFYQNAFAMKLIKKTDYPNGRFTLVFLGYGDEKDNTLIELTHNWDTDKYDLGTGFGHLAIGVDDIFAACKTAEQNGGKITREPGVMKFGGSSVIAFVEDPDGYKIELIESK